MHEVKGSTSRRDHCVCRVCVCCVRVRVRAVLHRVEETFCFYTSLAAAFGCPSFLVSSSNPSTVASIPASLSRQHKKQITEQKRGKAQKRGNRRNNHRSEVGTAWLPAVRENTHAPVARQNQTHQTGSKSSPPARPQGPDLVNTRPRAVVRMLQQVRWRCDAMPGRAHRVRSSFSWVLLSVRDRTKGTYLPPCSGS